MTFIKPFKIGNVEIPNNLVLAPMAAVNCSAFRLLCKNHGAGLTYTQMIDVEDYSKDTEAGYNSFIDKLEGESPLAVQIVGKKPEFVEPTVQAIDEHADIIDICLGCPEQHILKKQSGAFLLKHPEQIDKTINAITKNTNKPITAKIRSGWDKNSVNALEVSKRLEDLGVAAIAIHPRTKVQHYSGKADWNLIKQIKLKLNIPIIGNGNVQNPIHAKAMFKRTHCDAIMIGRTAINNPNIFNQINYYLEKNQHPKRQKVNDKKELFSEFSKYYQLQNRQRFPEIRQHAQWLFKDLNSSKQIRAKIYNTQNLEELKQCIKNI